MTAAEGLQLKPGQQVRIKRTADSILAGKAVEVKWIRADGAVIIYEEEKVKMTPLYRWDELEAI